MRVRFKIRSTKIWITFRMLNYSVSTKLSHLNTCCASIRIHILEMLHSVRFLLLQHFKYFFLGTPPFVGKIETWIKTNDKISIKWHKNTYNWMGSIVESFIKICHKAYCQSFSLCQVFIGRQLRNICYKNCAPKQFHVLFCVDPIGKVKVKWLPNKTIWSVKWSENFNW